MRARPFLARLTLAALGMLLLGLLGAIGLGWAVREKSERLIKLLGKDRCARLHAASVRTLGTLLPADSDGDGIPDSVERYLKHDPHNPRDHPYLVFSMDHPGFDCYHLVALQPGERYRVRARAGLELMAGSTGIAEAAAFAPGMRLLLDPEPPGMLCLPGGTPSVGSLLVPVAADGAMEFDLALPEDAVPRTTSVPYGLDVPQSLSYDVEIRHPLSDYRTNGGLGFDVVWRLAPLPCTVQEVPFSFRDFPYDYEVGDKELRRSVLLAWRPTEPAARFYVEATGDQSGEPRWFIADIRPGDERACKTSYRFPDFKPRPAGPLRFRIVPIKPIPLRWPDERDQYFTAYRLRDIVPRGLFTEFASIGYMGYTIIPVASVAKTPESAKAIFQNIAATHKGGYSILTRDKDITLPDVSQVEPLVCNGFYVFQVKVQTGLLILVLDSAHPQAGSIVLGNRPPQ